MKKKVLYEKALQAQAYYEQLKIQLGMAPSTQVIFHVNNRQAAQLKMACRSHNRFPVSCRNEIRNSRKAVAREVLGKEDLPVTAVTAALSALDAAAIQDIGRMRSILIPQEPVFCDLGMAGMLRSRLYMCSVVNGGAFSRKRIESALWLQKEKRALLRKQRTVRRPALFKGRKAAEEQRVETGERQPLLMIHATGKGLLRGYGKLDAAKGDLSGIRVLDLSRFLAGPLCTRALGEHGAEVLRVLPTEQEDVPDSFLELDGWAGKKWVHLGEAEQKDKLRELIRDTDILVYSHPADLEAYGIRECELTALNTHLIRASFTDLPREGETEASAALRWGYLPGLFLLAGVLKSLQLQISEGGSYRVEVSSDAVRNWLEECRFREAEEAEDVMTQIREDQKLYIWRRFFYKISWTAAGDVFFPAPVTWSRSQGYRLRNMRFTDNCKGFEER